MKKNLFLASIAIIGMAGAMVMSSCSSKGDDLYSPDNAHKDVVKEYKANFVKYYGEVNPKETWDFSHRGSALAGVATTRGQGKGKGQGSNNVQDMSATESYGYEWNYSNKESTIAKLFNENWGNIVSAFGNVSPTTWAPASDLKIIFSVVGVSRDAASNSKYFEWGIANTPEGDLFIRQSSPANGKNAKIGNSAEQHTSSLDFSQIPAGSRWYTAFSDKKQFELTSSNSSTIADFKVVTLNIGGTDYTFWGFKCDGTNPDYTNLVLWVREVESVPVPVVSKRYMVEDLGGADDFDFNDVVFDVVRYSNGTEKCFVRALGGTLDITIKIGGAQWSKSEDYNVKEMLNTNPIDKNKCLKEFAVTGWNGYNSNVRVVVKAKDSNSEDESSYYTEEFPNAGDIPLMVATQYGKTWQKERDRVTELSWFTTSDVDLSED